jgi:hypothetical protein
MLNKAISYFGIVEKAGGGAIGVVYRVEDTRVGRRHEARAWLFKEVCG